MLPFVVASYSVTDLHLDSDTGYLNSKGVVAAQAKAGNDKRCFVSKDGKAIQLPENVLDVKGINSRGQVAVFSKEGPGIWENGKMTLAPKDVGFATIAGIDDKGNLLGWMDLGSEGFGAVHRWPDKLESGFFQRPYPYAVAPDGVMVGVSRQGLRVNLSNNANGWLWNGKVQTPIGDAENKATPVCISANHIVGGSYRVGADHYERPFVWFNGQFSKLPLPDGEQQYGKVTGVNDFGTAVGYGDWLVKTPDGGAFLHKGLIWRNGKVQLLEDLLDSALNLEIRDAFAINNDGTILAAACPKDTHWPRTLVLLKPR